VIFAPDLAAKISLGEKTQTRRPTKRDPNSDPPGRMLPCRYAAGRTYAVQLSRGGMAVDRIRVLSVERVITHEISREDAIAEGFASPDEFMARWKALYGPSWSGDCWRIEFRLEPTSATPTATAVGSQKGPAAVREGST